jgi:hypothetical protein
MLTLATKCPQMLTHVIDAPLPESNSTIVLYYYSKDFPSVYFDTWKIFTVVLYRNITIRK